MNVGLKFVVPEELFMGDNGAAEEIPKAFVFDPRRLKGLVKTVDEAARNEVEEDLPLFTPTSRPLVSPPDTQDMILLVGPPGSGKTFFAHRHLVSKGYVHINQDKLKTKDHCLKAARKALEQGLNVVVDNTNPDDKVRAEYISMAKGIMKGGTVRAFWMVASTDLCEHNAKYRAVSASGRHASEDGGNRREMIPDIAFRTFWGRFLEPKVTEGFDEVKKVRFVPDFETEEERKVWASWH